MITPQTTLIIAICIGITAFSIVGWLIERWDRKWYQKHSREILDDWNQSTAMWSELSNKLADENTRLRNGDKVS